MKIHKSNFFLLTLICLMSVSVFLSNTVPQYKDILTKCDLVEVESGEDDTEESNNDDAKNTHYNHLYVHISINKLFALNSFDGVFYIKSAFLDIFSPPPDIV